MLYVPTQKEINRVLLVQMLLSMQTKDAGSSSHLFPLSGSHPLL